MEWLLQHAADVPGGVGWLGPGERAVLARLRLAPRRRDWLLGRWTAKQLVARRLARDGRPAALAAIEIRSTDDGAPEIVLGDATAPYLLSISHRAGQALAALAAAPHRALGCDLEPVEARDPLLVQDFFAAEERAAVAAAADAARIRLVALIWSAKESALKALRTGLREDPRDVVVVHATPAAGWRELSALHRPTARRFDGWWCERNDAVLTILADGQPTRPHPQVGCA
jgi:4'-phosphopantetheinyl transferase